MHPLSFSFSTFTLEIDGKPTLIFQAKWQAEADELSREWVQAHRDQLVTKDRYGNDFPPILKVRIAKSAEKAAYDVGAENAGVYRDVKVVKLVDAVEHQNETHAVAVEPIAFDDPQAT
jgi:hypothetical protein